MILPGVTAHRFVCRPASPRLWCLRLGLFPHTFLLPLLLLLLLHAVPSSGGPSPPPLPELPAGVDALTCAPGGCTPLTPGSATPSLCAQPKLVLIYDDISCFQAAKMFAGYRANDLARSSGGEVILCRQALNLLSMLGYSFLATRDLHTLEACVMAGRLARPPVEHLLMVHGPVWELLAGDRMILNGHRIRKPFREECLFMLSLWGPERPWMLWPGDLRYYITSFPFPDNSYILQAKPAHCPTSKTYRPVRLPVYGQPYGVLFEKFKVMRWKVNETHPFSHNGTFWAELQRRVHLVVLDCSDDLAAKLQWGPDYRNRVTCWKDSPLSQEFSYHDLLLGATFFLGLGATPLSPTPVDLNYCRTPVIMPPKQHPFVARHAGPKEFYPVNSTEDVLRAVDDILANCSVRFVPAAAAGGGGSGGITKRNTCFAEPPTLDAEMDARTVAEKFRRLLMAKEIMCLNRPRKREHAVGSVGRL